MIFKIYTDESRQTKEKYMLFSGICVFQHSIDDVEDLIKKFKDKNNMHKELKWQKVSKNKIEEYKRFVDLFFDLLCFGKISFKCLIIDTHRLNNKTYNNNSKLLGFYKMYYQLFWWFGREYLLTDHTKFILHPDKIKSKYSLNELKEILNKRIRKYFKINGITPYKSIEPLDSKKSLILQLNDIILGGIGYSKNGYLQLEKSSKAKKELCNYILKKSKLNSLDLNTPFKEKIFCIWNFPLK